MTQAWLYLHDLYMVQMTPVNTWINIDIYSGDYITAFQKKMPSPMNSSNYPDKKVKSIKDDQFQILKLLCETLHFSILTKTPKLLNK